MCTTCIAKTKINNLESSRFTIQRAFLNSTNHSLNANWNHMRLTQIYYSYAYFNSISFPVRLSFAWNSSYNFSLFFNNSLFLLFIIFFFLNSLLQTTFFISIFSVSFMRVHALTITHTHTYMKILIDKWHFGNNQKQIEKKNVCVHKCYICV
jgi:hypothetical protein